MDVVLARTFLAVVDGGSFVAAADRINVTQSTVSARVKSLEEMIGKVLFERSKAGASLTAAGLQFQRHAQAMIRVWEHARLEIALPEGYAAAFTIGGQYSLWDGYLLEWLAGTRARHPEIAIKAQMGFSDSLMLGLVDGTVDLGVMYTPQGRPGYEVELLFEDELILVSCTPNTSGRPDKSYVLIDWGPEFLADHALNFPEISVPGTHLEIGSLSLQYLVQTQSSGYVPRRLVADLVQSKALLPVKGAPVFSYPAYAVYPSDPEASFLELILESLRSSAAPLQSP